MDEARLIRGIQQRDHNSFRILVGLYQRMVVNTCFGIVHNQADAEDLAQEVFLEIFTSAGDFRGDAKLSTWIYRVALNRSLNLVRNRKRHGFFQSLEEAFTGGKNKNRETTVYTGDQPDGEISRQQRTDILHHALDRLPEKQRIAFTLNKYEEMSYKQIAEVMKISLSSVETLIHRAKMNLQKQLYTCYQKKCI
jgi:RNA polymerase sigma-70 factor (ECF subfamily)